MATNAEIAAAIDSAVSAGITYTQLEALIKRAIAAGVADDGRLIASSGIEGVTLAFTSLDAAFAALERIHRLALLETNGGGSAAPCEFVA